MSRNVKVNRKLQKKLVDFKPMTEALLSKQPYISAASQEDLIKLSEKRPRSILEEEQK
ncbi:hypothetical protein CHS0354_036031, partial [Potamilus streckersoni]